MRKEEFLPRDQGSEYMYTCFEGRLNGKSSQGKPEERWGDDVTGRAGEEWCIDP